MPTDIVDVLRGELARKRKTGTAMLSSVCDPYQPAESHYRPPSLGSHAVDLAELFVGRQAKVVLALRSDVHSAVGPPQLDWRP